MAVLKRNPHKLSYECKTEAFRDENGDYHKGVAYWVENYMKCDAVPAGNENQITYEDGTVGTYSHTIYTSKKCREFKFGDRIKVAFDDGTMREFSVKGFNRYQLQSIIYV